MINELVVHKDYRGKGIGRRLLDKIKQIAKKQKINQIDVKTSYDNKKAVDFYKKNDLTDESLVLGLELNE